MRKRRCAGQSPETCSQQRRKPRVGSRGSFVWLSGRQTAAELSRQCFGEALVPAERVGVQCAEGLQGPENERKRERTRERKNKKVSDGNFPLLVRIAV